MGSVDQHHRGPALSSGKNLPSTLLNDRHQSFRARLWWRIRIDQNLVHARQALTLGERKHLKFAEIKRLNGHGWTGIFSRKRYGSERAACKITQTARENSRTAPLETWNTNETVVQSSFAAKGG